MYSCVARLWKRCKQVSRGREWQSTLRAPKKLFRHDSCKVVRVENPVTSAALLLDEDAYSHEMNCVEVRSLFRRRKTIEADMPARENDPIDDTTDEGKKEAAAKKRNAVAVANFTMAFTSEGTMGLIYKATTTDWPSGLSHLIVRALMRKYRPQDTISRVELRQMLNSITMKKDADPATMFEQIASVENKYNTATKQIEEDDLVAVVLDSAPEKYQAVLTAEQRAQGNNLKLEHLETVMNQYWRQITGGEQKNGTGKDKGDQELVLSAFSGGKGFSRRFTQEKDVKSLR